MAKSLFKSKTFWVNLLVTLAGIFTAISQELATGTTLTIVGVINIVLRIITKEKVKL